MQLQDASRAAHRRVNNRVRPCRKSDSQTLSTQAGPLRASRPSLLWCSIVSLVSTLHEMQLHRSRLRSAHSNWPKPVTSWSYARLLCSSSPSHLWPIFDPTITCHKSSPQSSEDIPKRQFFASKVFCCSKQIRCDRSSFQCPQHTSCCIAAIQSSVIDRMRSRQDCTCREIPVKNGQIREVWGLCILSNQGGVGALRKKMDVRRTTFPQRLNCTRYCPITLNQSLQRGLPFHYVLKFCLLACQDTDAFLSSSNVKIFVSLLAS